MIRVVLPAHLKTLAKVTGEVRLEVAGPDGGPATQRLVLDALEARYPMLLGTIRDRHSGKRRAFVRFYACEEDLSHSPPDAPLPEAVLTGAEPYIVLGAMAGG
ncbi:MULTISPECIES: MoaD/ThiS family protein [unclassified Micromonospora]|uniref:MoaD/ThiS family protein n=1 Tax=Micromonospora sp. NPDC049903 TaxID=3364276 RepID=UPI0037A8CC67